MIMPARSNPVGYLSVMLAVVRFIMLLHVVRRAHVPFFRRSRCYGTATTQRPYTPSIRKPRFATPGSYVDISWELVSVMLLPNLAGSWGVATRPPASLPPGHAHHTIVQHQHQASTNLVRAASTTVKDGALHTQPSAGTRTADTAEGGSLLLNREFKYTAIALKTTNSSSVSSRLGLRRRKLQAWLPRNPAKSSAKARKAVSQEEVLHGWRTFETLEGCALPLMMLGEVDEALLPVAERVANLQPSNAAQSMEAATPEVTPCAQPQQPQHPTQIKQQQQELQPQLPSRTHRCVRSMPAAAKPTAAAAEEPSPQAPTIILYPPANDLVHGPHPQQSSTAISAAGVQPALEQQQFVDSKQLKEAHAPGNARKGRRSTRGSHISTVSNKIIISSSSSSSSGLNSRSLDSLDNAYNIDSIQRLNSVDSINSMSSVNSTSSINRQVEQAPTAASLPRQVHQHLQACARALHMPRRILERHKWLVTELLKVQDHTTIQPHLTQLAECLHLSSEQVLGMVVLHPQLLMHSITHVHARAEQVARLLQGPEASIAEVSQLLRQHPKLLTMQHTPETAMIGIAQCLAPSLGMQGVVQLLYRCPNVLTHPQAPTGQPYHDMVSLLAEELGCSQQEAIQTWVSGLPEVLLRSPAVVSGSCRAFAAAWDLDAQQGHMADLMAAAPTLLLFSEGSAKMVSSRLKGLLRGSKHWSPDVARLRLKPRVLARMLLYDTSRYDRLDYLVSTLRDGGIDWREALSMADEDWHDMYPAYKQWWAQRGR